MRKMVSIMSHDLTFQQISAARTELGVEPEQILILPAELRAQTAQVNPEGILSRKLVADVVAWIATSTQPRDWVLVQGEPGLQTAVVLWAQWMGRRPIYSTTRRESVEVVGPDGAVNKQSRFAHVQYRVYPGLDSNVCECCGAHESGRPEYR